VGEAGEGRGGEGRGGEKMRWYSYILYVGGGVLGFRQSGWVITVRYQVLT